MAGNSQRKGAVRKSFKGSAPKGSGGKNRGKLTGKGPTPKKEERSYHPAAKRARSAGSSAGASQSSSRAAVSDAAGRGGAAPAPARRSQAQRGQAQRSQSQRGQARSSGARRGPTAGKAQPGRRNSRAATEIIAGRNPVVEALRARVPGSTLYAALRIDLDERVREAISLATKAGIALVEVSRVELDRLTDDQVHQGLALAVPPYTYVHPNDLLLAAEQAKTQPLLVALDSVTDPRNAGAIIRSAAAFGAQGVLLPSRRSVGVTAAVWKSSAGALARVPIAQASNLVQALTAYQQQGLFVVGLDGHAQIEIAEVASGAVATGPLVVVVGAEDKGLSRLVSQTCDQIARIPIDAATESLNASVAASLALYEIAKARRL